jgi:hypothetical protein
MEKLHIRNDISKIEIVHHNKYVSERCFILLVLRYLSSAQSKRNLS